MAGGTFQVYVTLCCILVTCRGQSYNQPGYSGSSGTYGQQPIGGAYGQTDRYNTDRYNNINSATSFGGGQTLEPFQPVYEWFRLDYNWIDEMTKQQAVSNRRFIPENNALAGIKVWRDRIFVTIPRWKDGVPVTIASVPKQPLQPNSAPRLEAFPNWQMQEIGNCSAFQFVQSMEIDTEGRMWILDSGRVNILDGAANAQSRCPPKLVIIDLNSVQYSFGNTQFGPNQQYPNQQFPGQNPNQPFNQGQGQYPGQQNYNNPNQQYPNNQYNPNNPNQYNPNNPNQYNPNNPNQYNPSNPNQYNPNNPNQYNPNNPNQYNPNNPSQYNPNNPNQYNNPNNQYNRNQYGSNQYGSQNQYGQYNNTPRYDQFGNPIPGSNYGGSYNQGGINQGGFNQGGFNQGGFNQGFNQFGNNFRIIKSFNFPSNVATQYGNYLNDIVLDNANGWYAYITDHGDDPGIIVYSFREDRAWKVKDARSMRADPDVGFVSINNIDVELRGKNIDGIALSPAAGFERTLYFCSLGSYNLYSVPTSALKNQNANSDISSSVTDLGRKQSITDGMIMDNRGNLYFGVLGLNAVGVWNTNRGRFTDSQRILARDNRALQWPDTFAIDDQGNLYVVTNRLQNYLTGRVSLDEPNYRILRAPIGAQSYLAPAQTGGSQYGGGMSGGRQNSYDSNYGGYNSYWYYGAATSTKVATGLVVFVSALSFLLAR